MRTILRNKSLLFELVKKELTIRYHKPVLGFFWSFLSPLFLVLIFYIVFSFLLKVQITEAPYLIYLMSAVFPWRFFHDSVQGAMSSLVDNRNLIKESPFAHYLIPLSIVIANAIIFLPTIALIIIVSTIQVGHLPSAIIFLPIICALHFIFTASIGVLLSLYYVKWRDLKYILEIVLTFLFYLTPCFYSVSIVFQAVPSGIAQIYTMNPFVGFLNLYRMTCISGYSEWIHTYQNMTSSIISPIFFTIIVLLFARQSYRNKRNTINDHLFY